MMNKKSTQRLQSKMKKFTEVAQLLNKRFGIIPLLFGSLGLEFITGEDFHSDDIDILIPQIYIEEKWKELRLFLEQNNYILVDLHEHTFEKYEEKFSFSCFDNLKDYAGIEVDQLDVHEKFGGKFKTLDLIQYHSIYLKAVNDPYRIRMNKTAKDLEKLKYIKRKTTKSGMKN